jgi:hypothetical protein
MPRRVEGGPRHQHDREYADHHPGYPLGQGREQPGQHDIGGKNDSREAGVRRHVHLVGAGDIGNRQQKKGSSGLSVLCQDSSCRGRVSG